MIDLEPDVINKLNKSKYAKLYNPEYMLSHKEGGAGCFARGHYTVGKEFIDQVNDKLRLIIDNCDNVKGFIMNHAVGGGTGSGLGSLILERIAVDYRKKSKLGFEIYPFNDNYSNNYVEVYNSLLATHWLLDHTEVSAVFDNRKLRNICNDKLLIYQPSYFHMNSLMAKTISSMTVSSRFEGELNVD